MLSKGIVNDKDDLIAKGLRFDVFTSTRYDDNNNASTILINDKLIRLFAKYWHDNKSIQRLFNGRNVNDKAHTRIVEIWNDAIGKMSKNK